MNQKTLIFFTFDKEQNMSITLAHDVALINYAAITYLMTHEGF